ncbi:hypothetical protein IFM89_012943 [Coptis chinensis]|uniref:Uncharacterized protein n=1 Tax=Coptis chinensis TaxID=261450 RepID=A0A835IXX4_9MAGN|nr:hypothetical protein IFM89_012943 [Coptis chinensis]
MKFMKYSVATRETISLWHDPWLERRILNDSQEARNNLQLPKNAKVSSLIINEDRIIWTPSTNGEFTTKFPFDTLRTPRAKVKWYNMVWGKLVIPRHSFTSWQLFSVSSFNDAIVSKESPSTARASTRTPFSLNDAVVSRESPSTAMATVNSPFSPSLPRTLRNTGSPSFSRESAHNSGNTRGKEVVVYTTQEQTQSVLEQEESVLTEEELFQFHVDNNAYAALVIEDDGIDDDISETHEEPFDDHIVTSPLVTRLQMLSQVVTRAQLQQQQL